MGSRSNPNEVDDGIRGLFYWLEYAFEKPVQEPLFSLDGFFDGSAPFVFALLNYRLDGLIKFPARNGRCCATRRD